MNRDLKKRIIPILLLFLLVFVSIGTTSAVSSEDSIGNVDTVSIGAVENMQVSVEESEILSEPEGTFTNLNELVENTSENCQLNLTSDFKFSDQDNELINGIILRGFAITL